jgi:TP901 family phage tail tape measure protein/lambda family phage tail tape measure protein
MPPVVNISAQFVGLQQSLEKQIAAALAKTRNGLQFPIDTKSLTSFNQQLDRATQRVVTLGTAFSVLATANRAIRELVNSTVSVEKSLTSVNAIFRLTNDSLNKFSSNLFDISRETATSFDEVAKAATEFARQGLSVVETQKAVRASLLLSRDANIDVEESVKAITSATNSFNKEALSRLQIVNRLASVDAAFAVSSKDLAEALVRTGSAAADAGVNFNQFIGLVTAAQQVSQRGGSVIAGALNTIFTRINRKDTLEALDSLGVAITDVRGQALPTIQVLQNFATAYDKMTGSIKNQAAELVGGVRQLNTLKATLQDLSQGENSVFNQVQSVIARSSNEIERRNAARNTTLAALGSQIGTTAQQVGSNIGNVGLANAVRPLLNTVINNPITQALQEANGSAETIGGQVAQTFLKGFGSALVFGAGPLLLKVFTNVGQRVIGNIVGDIGAITGLSSEEQKRAAIEQEINTIYRAGGVALQQQLATMSSLTQQAAYLRTLLGASGGPGVSAGALAAELYGAGYRAPRRSPRAAGGYLPFGAEANAIAAGIGGAPASARPVYLSGFRRPDGQGIVANSSEWIVPGAAGGYPAIYNRAMIQQRGLPPGSTPVAAGGYVPNAADSWLGNVKWSQPANSAYEAALLRAQDAENKAENVIAGILSKLSSKIVQSAATLNANASIAGLGGVLQQGPVLPSLSSPAGFAFQAANAAIISATSNRAGGAGSVISSAPYSGLPYVIPNNLATASPPSGYPRPIGPVIPAWYKVAQWNQARANGAINRTLLTNSANQLLSAGTSFSLLSASQQQAYVNQLKLQAYQQLGLNPATAYFNANARTQVNALIAPQLAAARAIGTGSGGIPPVLATSAPLSTFGRLSRFAGSTGGTLALGLGLPFLSEFISEGRGGTGEGKLRGAERSALQLAGTGATVGSFFSPAGTLIGAGIGAGVGALYGAISKSTKSFEELSTDLDQKTKKLNEELATVIDTFRIQSDLKDAIGANNQEQVVALKRQLATNRSQIRDPRYLALLAQYAGNPEAGQVAAARLGNSIITPQVFQSNLLQSLARGETSTFSKIGQLSTVLSGGIGQSLFAPNISKNNAEDAASAIGGIISGLSSADRQKLRARAKTDLSGAIGQVGGLAGLGKSDLADIVGKTQNDSAYRKLVHDALFTALNNAGLQESAPIGGITNAVTRERDLIRQAALLRRGAVFTGLAGNADLSIANVQNQIDLAQPGLTDYSRLFLQGRQGAATIAAQRDLQASIDIQNGKANLIELAQKTGTDQNAFAALKGINSLAGLQAFRGQLFDDTGAPIASGQSKFPFLTDPKFGFGKALEDLINQLEANEKAAEENTRANDVNTAAQLKQLDLLKSFEGVRANLRTSLTESVNAQRIQDRAIIDLAGNPDTRNLVNGSALSSAKLGQATRAGANGNSAESFARGFGSVFAGAKQDIKQFAEVGAQVANALSNSFSQAFGDFVTGTKKAKDAFREFVVSVLAESARIFATKAVVSLLGSLFGNIGGGFNNGNVQIGSLNAVGTGFSPGASATGGFIGRAAGGSIPTMLTGGEFVYPPAAAARIGGRMLRAVNGGSARAFAPGGLVRGGSGVADDVFQPLAAGSFVVRKAMVERYGANNLAALPDSAGTTALHFASGGPVAAMMGTTTPVTTTPSAGGAGGGVFHIGVTINDNSTTTQTSAANGAGGSFADKSFGDTLARRMKQVALQTIEEQKRIGGMLRPQSNLFPS